MKNTLRFAHFTTVWTAALVFGFLVGACGDGGTGGDFGESCFDGRRNGLEIDVDCGGDCRPCAIGRACVESSDCVGGATCNGGICEAEASCSDNERNGDESDVDCGGSCDACALDDRCTVDGDCSSDLCVNGRCARPSCSDGRSNGDETGVDCGGRDCEPCAVGGGCADGSDCASQSCVDDVCAAPSCTDGVTNGDELATDCGAAAGCPGCAVGTACGSDGDCASGVCSESNSRCAAPTCTDGRANQDETDVDCGGATCGPCADGAGCEVNEDCVNRICQSNMCVGPACSDGVRNGRETDVDCGGPRCPSCAPGLACEEPRDCSSGLCPAETLVCPEPSCSDAVQNGDEIDVDCGGDCGKCAVGQFCGQDEDCLSDVCDVVNLECEAPSCRDGKTNQDETDVDCGGSRCARCADGLDCAVDDDCLSLSCDDTALTCDASSCTDGIRNGLESGVDCGGPTCPDCGDFLDDFESGTLGSDWVTSGDADWVVSAGSRINGTYAAENGDINDNQSSTLELTVTVGSAGNVSFEYEVSTELSFDFLIFSIDGVEEDSWSGTTSGSASYPLSAGTHTLEWEYSKDISVSSFDDTVWIDDVEVTDGGP